VLCTVNIIISIIIALFFKCLISIITIGIIIIKQKKSKIIINFIIIVIIILYKIYPEMSLASPASDWLLFTRLLNSPRLTESIVL